VIKKILIFMILLGFLFGLSITSVSADNGEDQEPPPRPGGECEINEWEMMVVERMAKRYDVTTDEITYWYCMDYGFGEIALAFEISIRTDKTVEEIFAMREEGLTWIEILKEVGLMGLIPARWRWDPIPVPPQRPLRGEYPFSDLCVENELDPIIDKLAKMYGMTYEQAYQWLCGPYDYAIFYRGYLDDLDSRLGDGDLKIPNIDNIYLPDIPDFDDISDLIDQAREIRKLPGLPKDRGRP